jgi:hypothetical protein
LCFSHNENSLKKKETLGELFKATVVQRNQNRVVKLTSETSLLTVYIVFISVCFFPVTWSHRTLVDKSEKSLIKISNVIFLQLFRTSLIYFFLFYYLVPHFNIKIYIHFLRSQDLLIISILCKGIS